MKDYNPIYAAAVGSKLKTLRLEKRLVQADIGNPALISSIEKGRNLPGCMTIGRYIELFGLEAVAKAMDWKYNS